MAIVLQASVDQSTSGTSFTAVAGASSNYCLVAGAFTTNNVSVTNMDYGASAMTKIMEFAAPNASANLLMSLWILVNPPTGSNAMTITAAGGTSLRFAADSFSGVDQVTGYNVGNTNQTDQNSAAPATIPLTTQYSASILVGAWGVGGTTLITGDTDTTFPFQNSITMPYSSSTRTPAGLYTLGYTNNFATNMSVIELIEFGATPPATNTGNFFPFF